MAELGKATLELRTDSSNFDKGVQGASEKMDKFRKRIGLAMAAAGTAVVGFSMLAVRKFAEYADGIDKMSGRTGLSTDLIQEMTLVMNRNGESIDKLDKGFITFSKMLDKFNQGEPSAGLDKLGFATGDLVEQNGNLDATFLKVLSRLREVEDDTQRARIASEVFAGAGKDLLITLKMEEEAFNDVRAQAHELGIVLGEELVGEGAVTADAMADVAAQMESLKVKIGAVIAPFLINFVSWIGKALASIMKWRQENRTLFDTIIKLTVSIGGILVVLGPLILAWKTVAITMAAVRTAQIALTIAMAANPIGAIAVAVTALIAGFFLLANRVGGVTNAFKFLANIGANVVSFAVNMITQSINDLIAPISFLGKLIGKDWSYEIPKLHLPNFELAMEKAAEAVEEPAKAIEETNEVIIQSIQETAQRVKVVYKDLGNEYLKMYDGMERTAFKAEKHITNIMEDEYLQRFESLKRTKFKEEALLKGEFDLIDPRGVRQQMGAMGAASNVSAGERSLIDDLRKSGGAMQVSTGMRDERGGVIFREATQKDFDRIFKSRIEAALPQLPGATGAPDTQSERNFASAPWSNLARGETGDMNINIQVDGKDLNRAIVEADEDIL